jgi:hydroxymethylpyrimidine pyrophosphatase-like HAD family hydrolase
MGTEIELDGTPLQDWHRQFAGWNRGPIDSALESMGFEAHPANLQTAFKASYAVPKPDQERATEAVRATGIPTRIICSGDSDFDVLPPKAGKGSAAVYLARRLEIPFDHLIVAGDSANDLEMFRAVDRGIVVGNASAGLREAVDRSKVFFAQSDCAAGLIEGLRHWNVPITVTTT